KGSAESTERLLLQEGLLIPWLLWLFDAPWYGRLLTSIEQHTVPGQMLVVGLRKRFMDDETRAALARGVRQVLVVGAGLDTLCWRLTSEYPETTFVEADHPATQAVKRRALEGLGGLPRNLHLLPVDLVRTPLDKALRGLPVWQTEAPSVVVAEAVLMYLEEASVLAFLEAVRRCTGPESRLLLTCIREGTYGGAKKERGARWFMELGLQLMGEPIRWRIREEALRGFLARHGFRPEDSPERVDLHRRYLVPAGLSELSAEGFEFPAVAEKAGPPLI
ncbi:MAG TPA: SAM-dependent methyltransferase, partial [Myxococcaceae bacterium]|nr:SAM-dependent methyltransferase [Myxococcaceae bacterium]